MTTNEIKPNNVPTSTQAAPGGDCGASACSADWKAIAEEALSAAEFLYLFWNEGFGTDFQANEMLAAAFKRYKDAGGEYVYLSNTKLDDSQSSSSGSSTSP